MLLQLNNASGRLHGAMDLILVALKWKFDSVYLDHINFISSPQQNILTFPAES